MSMSETMFSLSISLRFFALALLFICESSANTEKTIFVTPPPVNISPTGAAIDNLLLTPLNPIHSTVRTTLNASFPTAQNPRGTESWFLLDGLEPGRRYEVRLCWLATQPTSFWIDTHTVPETFEDSGLISSLSAYSYARHADLAQSDIELISARKSDRSDESKTIMFLQIHAAADYFTLNKTLMNQVPPVYVDVILDPYLLNVFPRSLLPTAGYITIIALFAWYGSGWVHRWISDLSATLSGDSSVQLMKKSQ